MTYVWARWEAAERCTDGPEPGARALLAWLLEETAHVHGRSLGIYNCRSVRGASTRSIHGEGRAVDLGLPMVGGRGNPIGRDLIRRLGPHGRRLGIQAMIFDREIWSATSPSGRRYTGVAPHYDHIHAELTRAAGARLTLATIRAVVGSTRPVPPTPPEEDDVFTVKYGQGSRETPDPYVTRAQRVLDATAERLGMPRLEVDGIYRGDTAAAVDRIAARAGLPKDGGTGMHVLVLDYCRNWLSAPQE